MQSKILFLIPYPHGHAPSQRFRFEQYFEILAKSGHRILLQSFLTSQNWQIFFKSGRPLAKMAALFSGFLRRAAILFAVPAYDYVFIHRECAPVGPPIFEWFIARVLRKKIIYDFDDAIWLTDRKDESAVVSFFKWRSKVGRICRWSFKVSCGNEYLCDYARQFNTEVVLNPTTIEVRDVPPPPHDNVVTIGWTGTHSTMKYLKGLKPVLERLKAKYGAQLNISVIADRKPDFMEPDTFTPWRKETEIEDVLHFDIGIMPLPDDEWTRGKCGFKALQYLSLGIPAVCSPVGVNTRIIRPNENGFLCSSENEWMEALELLINDPSLRKSLGAAGKRTVISDYSVAANSRNFLSLFA